MKQTKAHYQTYRDSVFVAVNRIPSLTFVWLLLLSFWSSLSVYLLFGIFGLVLIAISALLLLANFEYAERTADFQSSANLSPRAKTLERILVNSIPIFLINKIPAIYFAFAFVPFTVESVLFLTLSSLVYALVLSVVMVLPYLVSAKVRSMKGAPR